MFVGAIIFMVFIVCLFSLNPLAEFEMTEGVATMLVYLTKDSIQLQLYFHCTPTWQL